ncbi:histidine phosphatase family protein [Niastella sp. OAS944]|uniref:histidine phosphatase family protein n=1 Tax=Niastella sp. OAS944 TaxID=2664089 RepID=UPI00347FC882|nr:alpha-ribazole phosphatase/probable phosphoglycerate mutase [Chitinophagaceae bacterium OAS944]
MLNIYLIRHGETAWNADNNRYCGRTDIPLTEKGLKQAETLRQQLVSIKWDAVFSSPLQRAHTTAQIASGATVIKDDRLIEADFGMWEGKTKEEFVAENAQLWTSWMNDPANNRAGGTGETGAQIVQRVDDFFQSLQTQYSSGNFLVAAHNGVNRLYLSHKLGMPLSNYRRFFMENALPSMFTLEPDGEFVLRHLNSKF